MEERFDTSVIKEFVNKKNVRKQTTHSEEFLEKKKAREELKLRESLIQRVKSEDPRYFLTDSNIVRIPRLPGETYKLIPTTTRYYVSDMGNALKLVYDKPTDTYLERPLHLTRSRNKTGKYYVSINVQTENGKRINCRLSRAIIKAFVDPTFGLLYEDDKRIVDHIDNNSENNVLSNFRICTSSENIRFAIVEQGKIVGMPQKKCYAYNIDTKELREYSSTSELVSDIFNKNNNGYFSHYNDSKHVSKAGWTVGYDADELKTRVRRACGPKRII